MQSYCHEVDDEAWCFARSNNSDIYLRPEAEVCAEAASAAEQTATPFGAMEPASETVAGGIKGFDFTTASQTPTFSAFASTIPGEYEYELFGYLC